jgi:hypothetical protein
MESGPFIGQERESEGVPITCICPACQKTLAIGEEYAGQAMRCPLCMALFQAPPLMPQNQPAGVGAAGTPPWQPPPPSAANGPQVPRGPVWGGVGDNVRPRSAPLEGQEWDAVRGATAGGKLEPGWHMVYRGLMLMPFSLTIVFTVFAVAGIILLFPVDKAIADSIKLIAVPTIIFTGVLVGIGGAMCCLVPQQSNARMLALAATGCLTGSFLVFLLTMGISKLADSEGNRSGGLFMTLAYLPTLLLLLAGCVIFLLFGRAVAIHLNHKRLGQSALVGAIFLGVSPLVLGILVGLVAWTAKAIGGQGTGKDIIISLIYYVVIAIDLFWFLRLARDLRRAVLRGFVTTAV